MERAAKSADIRASMATERVKATRQEKARTRRPLVPKVRLLTQHSIATPARNLTAKLPLTKTLDRMDVVTEGGVDGAGATNTTIDTDTDTDTVEVDELIATMSATAMPKLVERAQNVEAARLDADEGGATNTRGPAPWQKELCAIATATTADLNGEGTKRKLTAKQEAKLKMAQVKFNYNNLTIYEIYKISGTCVEPENMVSHSTALFLPLPSWH